MKVNNIAVGLKALPFLTEGSNNVCIGENAGFDITDESDQVRIGNFTLGEVECNRFSDSFIFNNGRVVIKRDVLEMILGEEAVEEMADLRV